MVNLDLTMSPHEFSIGHQDAQMRASIFWTQLLESLRPQVEQFVSDNQALITGENTYGLDSADIRLVEELATGCLALVQRAGQTYDALQRELQSLVNATDGDVRTIRAAGQELRSKIDAVAGGSNSGGKLAELLDFLNGVTEQMTDLPNELRY